MSDQKIITKLRALLAKAEGTTGAEAESFMTKVREMMVKHQIEMHTLRQEPDPLGGHDQGILLDEQWAIGVCNAGAEYLGCATIFNEFSDSKMIGCRLYGRRSACVTATQLLGHWIMEVRRMAQRYQLPAEDVGNALSVRIARLIAEQGPAPNTTGTDLVPIDEARAAAMGDNETETREVAIKPRIEAVIVAEQIGLDMQVSGHQKHKELS